ncbi:hypothetical protein BgAZ_110950 [Babesia gibsoni]|uniref:Uncharacterized protein n=1 Tax=Babesia gibsoni TaxID=33632 RepID=A0AAD8PGY0_BABGI|nr:hypothetical protein BgAZ_110950 [Babesia gibsoni]
MSCLSSFVPIAYSGIALAFPIKFNPLDNLKCFGVAEPYIKMTLAVEGTLSSQQSAEIAPDMLTTCLEVNGTACNPFALESEQGIAYQQAQIYGMLTKMGQITANNIKSGEEGASSLEGGLTDATSGSPSSPSNSFLDLDASLKQLGDPIQRESAYFGKQGTAYGHYMKHFTNSKVPIDDARSLTTYDNGYNEEASHDDAATIDQENTVTNAVQAAAKQSLEVLDDFFRDSEIHAHDLDFNMFPAERKASMDYKDNRKGTEQAKSDVSVAVSISSPFLAVQTPDHHGVDNNGRMPLGRAASQVFTETLSGTSEDDTESSDEENKSKDVILLGSANIVNQQMKLDVVKGPEDDELYKDVRSPSTGSSTSSNGSDDPSYGKKAVGFHVPSAVTHVESGISVPSDQVRRLSSSKQAKEEKSVPVNPEPISAWCMSTDKKLLAITSVNGSLKVFMLDEHLPNYKGAANIQNGGFVNDPKPDCMIWGTISTSPSVETKAHLGFINSVYIKENDDMTNVATIMTTGEDSYFKLWLLHLDGKKIYLKQISEQLLKDVPISAVTLDQANTTIVAYEEGMVQLWNKKGSQLSKTSVYEGNLVYTPQNTVDAKCDILHMTVSRTGKYILLHSTSGFIQLYNANKMNEIGWAECRNSKGFKSRGYDVTGVDWNKKETLILVTTQDSRIRMLSITTDEDEELLQLEKFKGHQNDKLPVKAQFAGHNDEYVVCACEQSFIYVWKHHINVDKSSHDTNDINPTNTKFIRFKVSVPIDLSYLFVFNPGEWEHIKTSIVKEKQDYSSPVKHLSVCKKCTIGRKTYNTPQVIDVKELDVKRHILLMNANNDSFLQYSIISMEVLKSHFA